MSIYNINIHFFKNIFNRNMNIDFCETVLPIPQYQNTCWFTVILMCLLKSQYSRKLLLNKLKINSKSSKTSKIIYKLLIKTYIANIKTYEYFKKFDLHKFLKYFIDNNNLIKLIMKKGFNSSLFLSLIINKLNLQSLHLHHFTNKKELYCDYNEYKYNILAKIPIPTIDKYKELLKKSY